jgi:hypothetical protein
MAEGAKGEVLKIIQTMPEDASLEDIFYELYVRVHIERGLDDVTHDRTLSHDEVMRSVTEWLQSAGH